MFSLRFFYIFLLLLAFLMIFLCRILFFRQENKDLQKQRCELVRQYSLTDLCLSTDSPHARHLNSFFPMSVWADLPAFHGHHKSNYFFLNFSRRQDSVKK